MRSVIRTASERCPRCALPPRWCICAAHQDVVCPLEISVLLHHREAYRPSSTGKLINRLIPAARQHVWRRERQLVAADVQVPGRELWILHPQGAPAPLDARPEGLQVVLLDGSWRETVAMAQDMRGWGRFISLPMEGTSRYWLRAQSESGRFSTIEALMFLLQRLGLPEQHEQLRRQFELHVYAHLRARGQKITSEEFLVNSPARDAYADLIGELNVQRARPEDL
jgi:DTW domain-containing protein